MAYELPTNSRSPDDGPTTIRQSAEIFGQVAAMDPAELIAQHGFVAVKAAIAEANQQRVESQGQGYHDFYVELVDYGYRDTAKAIEGLIPGRPVAERLEALRDHRTLMALGMLANRSETSMQSALTNDRPYGERLVVVRDPQDKPYLRMIEEGRRSAAEVNQRSGCPFAALNGDKLPALPYVQFATWAGEMSIRLDQYGYDKRWGDLAKSS